MPRPALARTLLAASLLALATSPAVQAQTEELEGGRRHPPAVSGLVSLTLYSDTNLRGEAVDLAGSLGNFNAVRFNDKARSVEVTGGVWLLCTDSNLRGRCEYVDRTVRNLGEIGLSGNISSVQLTVYNEGPRSHDIAFFADAGFRGPFLGFDEGEASFGRFRFNDTASSVLVNRGTWLVCEDADYRGRCELLDASVDDLGAIGLNDRITSFRPYDRRREGPWRPPVVPSPLPGGGNLQDAFEGETTVFFPAPQARGRRIENREGAATRFCQDEGFSEAVYKARGRVLSDVLCR